MGTAEFVDRRLSEMSAESSIRKDIALALRPWVCTVATADRTATRQCRFIILIIRRASFHLSVF